VKRVRLLPVVICAASALFVFKAVGIATNGGYVLSGVTSTQASSAPAKTEGAAPASADGAITIPPEPTMTDNNPTIADPSPTLGGAADAGGGHAAAPAKGDAPAEGHGATAEAAPADHGAEAAVAEPDATAVHCPVEIAAPTDGAAPEGKAAPAAPAAHGADGAAGGIECLTLKDAEAVQENGKGGLTPLAGEGALATQKALLARLSERRTELESLQTELDMRSALVDAAEKRLEERAATVAAMEAQIGALVAEKKSMEDAQLKSIVNMYENMKPKEAASVFNTLDMEVLLKVARSMNTRKMAPIMAKMDTKRAEELTVRLAAIQREPTVAQATPTGQDISGLPQIVGQ
jgi:flagellar motility protein MotE (MotC chaperone)